MVTKSRCQPLAFGLLLVVGFAIGALPWVLLRIVLHIDLNKNRNLQTIKCCFPGYCVDTIPVLLYCDNNQIPSVLFLTNIHLFVIHYSHYMFWITSRNEQHTVSQAF